MDRSRDKRSRGRVSRSAPAAGNTPAAIHNPLGRIAIEDHTPRSSAAALAKRHTELRAAAVAADRNQMTGHSRLAGRSRMAGRKQNADRRRVAGYTRQTGYSRAAAHNRVVGHKQRADRRVVGLHLRLRRDQEKLQRQAAQPRWQSQ